MAQHIIAAVCSMLLLHAYYHYLDGKRPSLEESALNQAIVSNIGTALAYAGQTFLAAAVATSCSQLFWRTIRLRGHVISKIDSIIGVQAGPFSLSIVSALRASICVPLLALLVASMPFISISAPGSIKITQDFNGLESCTVLAPRNLSAWTVNMSHWQDIIDFRSILQKVVITGTYLPPITVCGSGPFAQASRCSYDLYFIGPGLLCENLNDTASTRNSVFSPPPGLGKENGPFLIFQSAVTLANESQIMDNMTLRLNVQAWDMERSVYQEADCTGVLRSYAISISTTTFPTINVTASRIMTTIHINTSQPLTFIESYVNDLVITFIEPGLNLSGISGLTGDIGYAQLDGSTSWDTNLAHGLEESAQNAALSIFSGKISTLNSDVPDILENVTTTCTYTSTAYQYTPHRLFLTYGIGIFVTILCTIWGSVAIRRNGVEESMDFSRMLRAILNERMYNARDTLDKDTIIKADETPEGALAPLES